MKRSTGIVAAVGITAALAVSVPLVLATGDDDTAATQGAGTTGRKADPAATAPATSQKDFVLSLPLAGYAFTREQQVVLDRAQIKLQESCVRRLSSTALPHREVPDATAAQEPSRRYGLMDLDSAKRYGYQQPDSPADNASLPRPDATQQMLLSGRNRSGDPVTTYKGRAVPKGGCSTEARGTVYGDHDEQPGIAVAQRIDVESYELSLRDSKVVDVFSDWSKCMKDTGYSYESPLKVTDDPEFADADYSDRERAVAEADVTCKLDVRLPQTWLAVESAIQKKLIGPHKGDLNKLSRSQLSMVERAESILKKN
ncbi:hypothetical protein STRCI_003777 [Streptomyces cinnabarinus]|uniref:Secreted protein n=1 Tax=Streptomyces cinnabarinus TaxID=67287 RepID=A0ABY7KG27_9ACTN|nr:hypothetical protein [Streptomyces cinnabarinus]WAZ22518.1 hypothetical protein STRCI_003777 [Streptomyces cinnabarinus]